MVVFQLYAFYSQQMMLSQLDNNQICYYCILKNLSDKLILFYQYAVCTYMVYSVGVYCILCSIYNYLIF